MTKKTEKFLNLTHMFIIMKIFTSNLCKLLPPRRFVYIDLFSTWVGLSQIFI